MTAYTVLSADSAVTVSLVPFLVTTAVPFSR
jgi:hypothetical protein